MINKRSQVVDRFVTAINYVLKTDIKFWLFISLIGEELWLCLIILKSSYIYIERKKVIKRVFFLTDHESERFEIKPITID